MTDNTEGTKLEDTEASPPANDEPGMSHDQNFAYWVTMMPFLAIAVVFIYQFATKQGGINNLINAAGVIVVGIFAASFVNVLTSGQEKPEENESAKT